MKETKQCNNGHFYREDLERCPLCSDKDLQNVDTQNTKLDNSSEKASLQSKQNIKDKIKLVLDKLRNWIDRNSRAISHILLISSFLFSLAAILEHLFLRCGGSADFIQFWEDISILTSICLSFLCLSGFTVLSFKSCHIYFDHLLFILGFLFSISAIIVITSGLAINQETLDFTLFLCLLIIWLSSFIILSFKFFHPYYSHILLSFSFLFLLFAIISFSSSPLLFACLSILCLSSFTVLSFKSCHPYYPSILFILSFLFYLFTIILIVFSLALNQESLSSKLIDLSFLTIGQSILCLIIGMVLKIKHTPPFFSFLKNKFFYIHFIAASIVTVLLFYFTLQLMDKYTGHAEEFELENFYGLTIDEASNNLEQNGLKYKIIDTIYTDSVPKGTIYKQNPSPGTFVKEDRTIYFTLNNSDIQRFKIPKNVFYVSVDQVKNELLPLFFKLQFVPANPSNPNLVVKKLELEDGRILEPGYDGGKEAEKGSTIIVHLVLL